MSLIWHALLQDNAASTTVVAAVGSNATLQGGDNTSAKSTVNGPGTFLTRSMLFNGVDDWVQLPNLSSGLGSNVGFMAWCRLVLATPGGPAETGFANLGPSITSAATHFPYTDSTYYISLLRATNNTTANRVTVTPPGGVVRTNWHHVAFTNQTGANGWKFWVNGVIVNQQTGNTLYWDDDFWSIGRSQGGATPYYLNGFLADARFYDHTPSEAEILAAMAAKDSTAGGAAVHYYQQLMG